MERDTATAHERQLQAIAARADRVTRERRQERERVIAERVRHARLEIDRLVAQIRAVDPDVRRIVLFGSLAKNSVKRPSFDIDLACCSRHVAVAVEQHGVELYRAQ